MAGVEAVRGALPEGAKDIKLNLQSVVLGEGTLSADQRWCVAIAAGIAARNPVVRDALVADARAAGVSAEVIDDAVAAAALMAMNNVYYRFRHVIGKASYSQKPARLRMNRIARPATNKADFELVCLAVSAINNCEACVKSHEDAVLKAGLSEDHVHDAIRVAAVVFAAAVATEAGDALR